MSQQTTNNENVKEYKYDAFISYRHTELDKYVAEKIHKYLEEFKLPKNVKNKKGIKKTRIERVFRDKEELTITNNLEDPIIQALKQSEYLIVICSPTLKESIWCRKEIETFIKFHGRNKILTVLIEGEPEESFPEELLFEEEVVKENGVDVIHRKNVEPLAADIRAKTKRQMCALLKTELLRIIAPIFGLEYDDLRQRHRERKIKRIMTATVSAATLGIAVGVAGVASALIINEQNNEIKKQNDEITAQKEFIENQNEKLLLNQSENLANMSLQYLEQDRRIEAINTALSSITEFEKMEMPYTASGKYSLIKALRVYDLGYKYKAQKQFLTDSFIDHIVKSPSTRYILGIDKANTMYIWDSVTGECVNKITDFGGKYIFSFVGDTMLAYKNKDGAIKVVDIFKETPLFIVEDAEYVLTVKGDQAGKYVALLGKDKINVYDATNGKTIYKIESEDGNTFGKDLAWCDSKLLYLENKFSIQESEGENVRSIKIVDIKSGDIIETVGDYNSIDGAKTKNGHIYIMSSHSVEYETLGMIFAIEESSGKIIWKNEYSFMPERRFELTENNGEPIIVTASDDNLICIEGKTGTEYYNERIFNRIADFFVGSDGYIHLISHLGNIVLFDLSIVEKEQQDENFECNVKVYDKVMICETGYLVLPMNSNYIIKYEKPYNEDKEIYSADDEMRKEMGEIPDGFFNCEDEAKKIGITNPEQVENIFYINENLAVVFYLDRTIIFYDVVNEKAVSSGKRIENYPNKYSGTDSEGNIYISGNVCGYIFDKEYNLIAEIEDMRYVDVENGYLIIGEIWGDLWKYPIYSTEELIDKAEKELAVQ